MTGIIDLLSSIYLEFAGLCIRIDADEETAQLVIKNYSQLIMNRPSAQPHEADITYSVKKQDGMYFLDCPKNVKHECQESSLFIYLLEKDITIGTQELRRDLYFMHGACLNLGDKTLIITGESGAGKSTTTWAMTHHGFSYLSDELSPIDLNTMQVYPYAHALCLKKLPPEPYTLPAETLVTDYTMHVPVEHLNGGLHNGPAKLTHIFLVKYDKEQADVLVEEISSKASASMQIYKNTLNHLCHENAGLPAATQIATNCDCYTITFNDVYKACLKIREILKTE